MIQTYQNIFNEITSTELLLLTVFGVIFLLRLLHLFLFTGKVLFQKKRDNSNADKNLLSLIITVRNEEENLKKNLPKILSLDNDNFEMVVVDDFSQDNSYLILGLLKERYKRLTISALNQETKFSTKLAQNIALKATNNNWILIVPVSLVAATPAWIDNISQAANNEKNVVIAYSTVARSRGFFNSLIRIENYFSYIKSSGYILNGIPFVYSDENVAFQKEKYFEIGGYGQKVTEHYANLELVINSFIRKKTTTVLFNKESSIVKVENVKRADYLDLLKKSTRIEKNLSGYKRAFLFLDELGKLLFVPISIAVIVLLPGFWVVFISLLGFIFTAYLFIIKITQNRLNERKIFIPSLIYDLLMPYYKLFFRWHFNRRSRKYKWKSRV
ncbi:MAG: glycosyltransferase [Draconibacterium sp.]|nr:glycosyltransferase [Draconibacterium sp.]